MYLAPDNLSRFVMMLDDNRHIDFVFSSSQAYDRDQRLLFTHVPTERQLSKLKQDPNCLFFANFIGSPSATIFRKNDEKFDSELKWVVDIDFYIRMLKRHSAFIFIKEPLIGVTSGSNR